MTRSVRRCRRAMVAISAAAHAIDALYGEITPMVAVPAGHHRDMSEQPDATASADLRDAEARTKGVELQPDNKRASRGRSSRRSSSES